MASSTSIASSPWCARPSTGRAPTSTRCSRDVCKPTPPAVSSAPPARTGEEESDVPDDASAIAARINAWAFARDQQDWDALRDAFHPDGTISISWYDGPNEGFVAASQRLAAGGNAIAKHHLGVPKVRVRGDRALSEVDVTIMLRAPTPAGEVDTTSFARFFDRLETATAPGGSRPARRSTRRTARIPSRLPRCPTRCSRVWSATRPRCASWRPVSTAPVRSGPTSSCWTGVRARARCTATPRPG